MRTLVLSAMLTTLGTYAGLNGAEIPAYLLIIAGIVTAMYGARPKENRERWVLCFRFALQKLSSLPKGLLAN